LLEQVAGFEFFSNGKLIGSSLSSVATHSHFFGLHLVLNEN